MGLEDELRDAAESGELFLLYQPIVEAASGKPRGYEALLRCRHPTYGALLPTVFLEAAEESGSIVEVGTGIAFLIVSYHRTTVQLEQGRDRQNPAVDRQKLGM
ncbi:EAL domain-containing protein (plasmid) [Rhizobium sp. 32-5/1]|uniref:EAL domain-containing protein n=1 Tax=Rhizobium sp. 32-5/1 TaxID=3019602 RepID=UPI00240E027A|nr:EAL domain-containing protein [Rhizobium sp. 32-5/1]WEZ85698.1 EAL domain-containing protein [Rhizobium sp. 32-5/1]